MAGEDQGRYDGDPDRGRGGFVADALGSRKRDSGRGQAARWVVAQAMAVWRGEADARPTSVSTLGRPHQRAKPAVSPRSGRTPLRHGDGSRTEEGRRVDSPGRGGATARSCREMEARSPGGVFA